MKKQSVRASKEANPSDNFALLKAEEEAKEFDFKPKIFTKRSKPKSPRSSPSSSPTKPTTPSGREAFNAALSGNPDGDDDSDEEDGSGGMNPLAMRRSDSMDSVSSVGSARVSSANSVTGGAGRAKPKGFISTTGNAKKDKEAKERADKREDLKNKAAELLEKRRAQRASKGNVG